MELASSASAAALKSASRPSNATPVALAVRITCSLSKRSSVARRSADLVAFAITGGAVGTTAVGAAIGTCVGAGGTGVGLKVGINPHAVSPPEANSKAAAIRIMFKAFSPYTFAEVLYLSVRFTPLPILLPHLHLHLHLLPTQVPAAPHPFPFPMPDRRPPPPARTLRLPPPALPSPLPS